MVVFCEKEIDIPEVTRLNVEDRNSFLDFKRGKACWTDCIYVFNTGVCGLGLAIPSYIYTAWE